MNFYLLIFVVAICVSFAVSQSRNFNPSGSSFSPQRGSNTADRTFYNTFRNQESVVQNNPEYVKIRDRYPAHPSQPRTSIQESRIDSSRNAFNTFENRNSRIQNKPKFEVVEHGELYPKTKDQAEHYLRTQQEFWEKPSGLDDPTNQRILRERADQLERERKSGQPSKTVLQTRKIQRETQALKSNRLVPKNLCGIQHTNQFTGYDDGSDLDQDAYFDATKESFESLREKFRNVDEFGWPIDEYGLRFRRAATDQFNSFGNRDSVIENEPSYTKTIHSNLRPSTAIGRDADRKAQQIFWQNSARILPQTAEGQKSWHDVQRLSMGNGDTPETYRNKNQAMRENEQARKQLANKFCVPTHNTFNNQNTRVVNNAQYSSSNLFGSSISPSNLLGGSPSSLLGLFG